MNPTTHTAAGLRIVEARDADEDDNVSESSDEELYPQERNHA